METHVAAASGAGGFKAETLSGRDWILCKSLVETSLFRREKKKKSLELNRKSCERQSLQVRVDKMKDS